MSKSTTNALLLLPEVAEIARAPESTVRHWIATGKLRATKPGRRVLVTRAELARFLGIDAAELTAA